MKGHAARFPLAPHARQAGQTRRPRKAHQQRLGLVVAGMSQGDMRDAPGLCPVLDQRHARPARDIHQVARDRPVLRPVLPRLHRVGHAQSAAGRRDRCCLVGAAGPQPMVHRHGLHPQARRPRQMQKGSGIPTARHRDPDRFASRQRGADQPDQPVVRV